jgi:hypothetical protein
VQRHDFESGRTNHCARENFLVLSPSLWHFGGQTSYFSIIGFVAKQINYMLIHVITNYMRMFNVTPHNKLILKCDKAAYTLRHY